MYTIREVEKLLTVSAHTLRYYDNQGMFPYVCRDKNNNRQFSDEDLRWVTMVKTLRTTGMPMLEVKHYIQLCQGGNATIKERAKIIYDQRKRAEQEQIELAKKIVILENKERYYQKLLAQEAIDYWNPDVD